MNITTSEGARASGGPKSAQQSESQPTATAYGSAPAEPAIELFREGEPKRTQHEDTNKAAKAERNVASKAVRAEKGQKIKTAKKKAQTEEVAAAKASNDPQTTKVGL